MRHSQFSKLIVFVVFFYMTTPVVIGQYINSSYKASKVANKVWAIVESASTPVNIYVVEGKDSALIIDTGYGRGDLKAYVKTLTNLPLIVVNTHGHGDHTGNDSQFSKIYAHPGDFDMINASFNREKRMKAALPGETIAPPTLAPVKDGYIFNLGDRKLEVIEVPGHTHGSICLLDTKNRLLFAGDNTNTVVWLFLSDCYPLEVYLRSLQKVEKRSAEYDIVMPGHNEPLPKAFISDQIGCVKSILAGTCSPLPYNKSAFTAGALLCSYQTAQVAYDPNNLRESK